MYKNATKCNETIGKWCKNKHGASKIIDTFETYHLALNLPLANMMTNTMTLTMSCWGCQLENKTSTKLTNLEQAGSKIEPVGEGVVFY
jgi:hypothetical protein